MVSKKAKNIIIPLLLAGTFIFGLGTIFLVGMVIMYPEHENREVYLMDFPFMLAITAGILFLTIKLYKKWKPDLELH